MTFMIRPRVLGPTGTRISEPVERTDWPRVRPSVESMAMVRTTFSPRCWATSRTRRLPLLSVSSADRIAGSSPSKATSTTAPITCATRPVRLDVVPCGALMVSAAVAMAVFLALSCSLERFGAGDDLDQFGRDSRLALAVVDDAELLDHVAGVARGVVHRGHLAAVEAGLVLQHRAIDLDGDVLGQKRGQDLVLVRLILHRRARRAALGVAALDLDRDDLIDGRLLQQHRPERRIRQVGDVELARLEAVDEIVGNRLR